MMMNKHCGDKEFEEICAIAVEKTKMTKLGAFQTKLASLSFLDPACGSGNFLTETYISLRRLENELLSVKQRGQIQMGDAAHNPIQISIGQFYGIEVNDFAVTVARTALWIAESQMMKETEIIVHMQLDYLPLKSYVNIIEGNALRIDWESVVPKQTLNYIMGNPPFVGNNNLSQEQRQDILPFFPKNKTMDYVTAWYVKSAEFIMDTAIRCAFVSTNSITQGEQVSLLWNKMIDEFGVQIDFAHSTFKWNSEASDKAAVHCVIVGFSTGYTGERVIFNGDIKTVAKNISPYIVSAPNVLISSRSKPICDVPNIQKGNQPTDGGHLIIEATEYDDFIRKEPLAMKYVKRLIGAVEFINNKDRYCLWLANAVPADLIKMPLVMERIEKCRQMRLASPDAGTRKLADKPMVFRETYNPDTFIVIPSVSSERRRYIPIGFLDSNTIATNLVLIIPNANLYHFGILTSNVHMAWMRAVCGR
jgi:hypothetical protein